MKITRKLGIVGLAAAAALTATGAPAYAKTTPSHTVEGVHAHVGARVLHITTKMQALKTKIAGKTHFSAAAKTLINADITKVVTDATAWRTQINAATTMPAIRAAAPARQAVVNDLAKLRTDIKAAKAAAAAAR